MKLSRYFLSVMSLFLVFASHAEAQEVLPQTKTVTVAVSEAYPFAYRSGMGLQHWEGISIELWEEFAKNTDIQFEYKEMTIGELLNAVDDGEAQVGLGAISITAEREFKNDFTHPYFESGLGIMVKETPAPFYMSLLGYSKDFSFLVGFIILGAVLYWFAEGRRISLFNSIYWSVTTSTTTGYGDEAPKTKLGKNISMLWMLISAVWFGSLIASIAATRAVDNVEKLNITKDTLPEYHVGVVTDTTSMRYATANNLTHSSYSTLKALVEAIDLREVDAGIYDVPMLKAAGKRYNNLVILPERLTQEFYAFVINQDEINKDVYFKETAINLEAFNLFIPLKLTSSEWESLVSTYLDN